MSRVAALAFDPNRTLFRGINKYKQIHPFNEKRGKGFRKIIANQSFYFRNN